MKKRTPRSDSAARALKEFESTYSGLEMPLVFDDLNDKQKTEFFRIIAIQPPSQWTNSSINLAADLAVLHVLVAQLQADIAKGIEPLITSPSGVVKENAIFGILTRLLTTKALLVQKMGLAQSDKRQLLQPSSKIMTERTKPVAVEPIKAGEFQKRLEERRKKEGNQ